ncbi:hypothetical protein [Ruficoccus sp. ZRK36]|uniref:hypothetical protein n=1 Tax=Ruficoccus sp. ZRK36 TaxID=2866311 RepID=UPI001C72D3F6|nr:hypothetical protein [Ruficoccus sp. ZRK36]QYY34465.1 hypothetical protein K0V07_09100 [Ruficoccus sp. ZRK36]
MILLTLLAQLFFTMGHAVEREIIPLTPDQAQKTGIRLGFEPLKVRHGTQIYIIGVDAEKKSRRKSFDGFRIVIQKPGHSDAELTARMWHQEWTDDLFYTSFEIEESFLPYLYVLVDYGNDRYEGAYSYRIPVRPYLSRKADVLPEGLKKMIADTARQSEESDQ